MWEAMVNAFKSKTVWLGLLVVVLSWLQKVVSDQPLPAEVVSIVGTVIGGLIVWLRTLTTVPLSQK